MAKKLTPEEIGNKLADTVIGYVEKRTASLTREEIKAVLKIVATRLSLYFLMRRL